MEDTNSLMKLGCSTVMVLLVYLGVIAFVIFMIANAVVWVINQVK